MCPRGPDEGPDHSAGVAADVPGARGPRRAGSQARSVIDALSRHDGFVSAQRLHLEMRTAGSRVGLTTVYKALNAAAADGYVDTVVGSDEGALFRRREEKGHDDYVRCRCCGKAVVLASLDLRAHLRRALRGAPFRDVSYTLDVAGECLDCAEGEHRALP